MALTNLNTSESYTNSGSAEIPKGLKYVAPYNPNNNFKNLLSISRGNKIASASGTPEALEQNSYDMYMAGNSLFKHGEKNVGTPEKPVMQPVLGVGIPTQQQFANPEGDLNTAIPVTPNYGKFMAPGSAPNSSLKWGLPKGTAQIRNIAGDVNGQYVEDSADPNNLIKTIRGENQIADDAIRAGRPGSMYQIDHIVPLSLGGADTAANRQLLTYAQNDSKTKAQSVAYTLYAHGEISLSEARIMAMHWQGLRTAQLPEPDEFGMIPDTHGNVVMNMLSRPKTGLEIARETAAFWKRPAEEQKSLAEKVGEIPAHMRAFGQDTLDPITRGFTKGLISEATMGFVPYDPSVEVNSAEHKAAVAGRAVGGLALFASMFFGVGEAEAAILGGLRAISAIRLTPKAVQGAALIKNSLGLYEEGTAIRRGIQLPSYFERLAGLNKIAQAEKIAEGEMAVSPALQRVFGTKTLNKLPAPVMKYLTPQNVSLANKIGVTSALHGQGAEFVKNHFNPEIIAGRQFDTEQESVFNNMLKDYAIGAVTGVQSPTLKGTALAAMIPVTMGLLGDPDHPEDALINGFIFGALHAKSTYKNPGYNNVEFFGGKPYENPALKSAIEARITAAEANPRYWIPDVMANYKRGEFTAQDAQNARLQLVRNVTDFYELNIPPESRGSITRSDFYNFGRDVISDIETRNAKIEELQKNEPEKPSFLQKATMDKVAREKAKIDSLDFKATLASHLKEIQDKYGPGNQSRNTIEGATLPDKQADIERLQIALQEIKRGMISIREMEKHSMTDEMHGQADYNDLLSFREENLKTRRNDLFKFDHPNIVNDALKLMQDPNFVVPYGSKNDNLNGSVYVGTSRYSKADANDYRTTGITLPLDQAQNKAASAFIAGNPGARLMFVKRPDWAPVLEMLNSKYTLKDRLLHNYETDKNPGDAYQVFGIMEGYTDSAQNTKPVFVPLGMATSEFHRNVATGKGHEYRNMGKRGDVYETEQNKNLRREDYSKDHLAQLYPNQRIIFMDMTPDSTGATLTSGNAWLSGSMNEATVLYNAKFNEALAQKYPELFDQNLAREKKYENVDPDILVTGVDTSVPAYNAEGFRPVRDGEILPNGYTTKIDVTTGEKITNAPYAVPKNPVGSNIDTEIEKFQGTIDFTDETGGYSIQGIKDGFKRKFNLEIDDEKAGQILSGEIKIGGFFKELKRYAEENPSDLDAVWREDNYNLLKINNVFENNESTKGIEEKPLVNQKRRAKKDSPISENIQTQIETTPEIKPEVAILSDSIVNAFSKEAVPTTPATQPEAPKTSIFTRDDYNKLSADKQAMISHIIPEHFKTETRTPEEVSQQSSSVDLPVESKSRYDYLDEAARNRNLTYAEDKEYRELAEGRVPNIARPIDNVDLGGKMTQKEMNDIPTDWASMPMTKIDVKKGELTPDEMAKAKTSEIRDAFTTHEHEVMDAISSFEGKNSSRGGKYDPENKFQALDNEDVSSISDFNWKVKKSDPLFKWAKQKIAQLKRSEVRGSDRNEVVTEKPTGSEIVDYLKNNNPGAGGAYADAKMLMFKVKDTWPKKIEHTAEATAIHDQMVSDLTQSVVHKISELHGMPLEDAQAVVDHVNRVRYDKFGEIKPKEEMKKSGVETIFGNTNWMPLGMSIEAAKISDHINKLPLDEQREFYEGIAYTKKDGTQVTNFEQADANLRFKFKDPKTNRTWWENTLRSRSADAEEIFTHAEKGMKQGKDEANLKPSEYGFARSYMIDKLLTGIFGKDYKNDARIGKAVQSKFYKEMIADMSQTADPSRMFKPFSTHSEVVKARIFGKDEVNDAVDVAQAERDQSVIDNSGFKSDNSNELAMLSAENMSTPMSQHDYIEGAKGDNTNTAGLTLIAEGLIPGEGKLAVKAGMNDGRNFVQMLLKAVNEGQETKLQLIPQEVPTGEMRKVEKGTPTDRFFEKTYKDYLDAYKIKDSDGPGLKKFSDQIDNLVSNKTLYEEDASILKELFKDTDDALLGKISLDTFNSNTNAYKDHALEKQFPGYSNSKEKIISMREDLTNQTEHSSGNTKDIQEWYKNPNTQPVVVFLHEYGHIAHDAVLSEADRKIVTDVYKSMSKEELHQFFGEGLTEKDRVNYFAKSEREFLAHSFAEYVLKEKVPEQSMKPLLERMYMKFKNGMMRLIGRSMPEKMGRLTPLYEKMLAGKSDGTGGPGVHDGAGGEPQRTVWGDIKNKMNWNNERYVAEGSNMNPDINSPLGSPIPPEVPAVVPPVVPPVTPPVAVKVEKLPASTISAYKPPVAPTQLPATKGYVKGDIPGTFSARGVSFTNRDLDEAADILYTEVGNRIASVNKRPFETRHIINTAINRALAAPNAEGKNIVAVLKKPYQYQGYAPNGSYSKGKIIESEYQRIKRGIYNKAKYDAIRQTLEELKNPDFKDTTGGATFYAHATDGTMWVGTTQEEVKKLVNSHEKKSGAKTTPWGTVNGLPVKVAER